jgi:hypothetical protein
MKNEILKSTPNISLKTGHFLNPCNGIHVNPNNLRDLIGCKAITNISKAKKLPEDVEEIYDALEKLRVSVDF